MNTKKLTTMALLTAIALIIFTVESQIPPLVPVAGVKLGLANIITLFSLFILSRRDTFCILIMRIVLGSIFSGRGVSFIYSLCGGILCFSVLALLKRFINKNSVWCMGVIGAVCHNAGQLTAAIIITKTPELLVYSPILLASAIITGLFTGFCTQFLLNSFNKTKKQSPK